MSDEKIQMQNRIQNRLNALRVERMNLDNLIRQSRKEMNEFLEDYGDVIAAKARADELEKKKQSLYQWKDGEKEEFLESLRIKNEKSIQEGISKGWWTSVENGVPIPHATVLSLKDIPKDSTIAFLYVHMCNVFPSIGQARKAGKTEPLVAGKEYRIKLKTGGMKVIRIVE